MPVPIPGRIVELLRQSTVHLKADGGGRESHGSGAVILAGRIVTNAHVVGSHARVMVNAWDGNSHFATVIQLDRRRDLALLSAPDLKAPPLTMGDSDNVRAGTPVLAVGNPLGFIGAASSGVVHSAGSPGHGRPAWIVADVHLAPGNSGGPLANLRGELIGINTMVVSGGLALAIPSRAVQAFLSALNNGQRLGVVVRPVRLRDSRRGLMLMEITQDGAVERASLLAGDVLVEADGRALRAPDDLDHAIKGAAQGILRLRFRRGASNTTREVTVTLGESRMPHAA